MRLPDSVPDRDVSISFEPSRLDRRRRRLDPGLIAVALATVLLLVAVARPWTAADSPASAGPPTSSPSSGAAEVVPPASAQPAGQDPNSPAPAPADPTRLATVIRMLAGYSGSWGVGAGAAPRPDATGGAGPDWSDWVAVEPDPIAGTPIAAAATGPNSSSDSIDVVVAGSCLGLPSLPSGAQIVAITAPSGPVANHQIQGWREVGWHDEPRELEPVPGIRQTTPFQSGDISYLQPSNGRAWLDGRYVFRIAGPTPLALTVCLG